MCVSWSCVLQEQLYGPPPEEKGHGTISLKTYFHYFRAGGGYLLLTVVCLVFLLGEVGLHTSPLQRPIPLSLSLPVSLSLSLCLCLSLSLSRLVWSSLTGGSQTGESFPTHTLLTHHLSPPLSPSLLPFPQG